MNTLYIVCACFCYSVETTCGSKYAYCVAPHQGYLLEISLCFFKHILISHCIGLRYLEQNHLAPSFIKHDKTRNEFICQPRSKALAMKCRQLIRDYVQCHREDRERLRKGKRTRFGIGMMEGSAPLMHYILYVLYSRHLHKRAKFILLCISSR
jgi:uncharacterized membrane protein